MNYDAKSYLNTDSTASKRNMNTTLMVLNKKQLQGLTSLHSTKVHHFLLLYSTKMTYNNHAVYVIYLCLQTNKIQ